MNNKHLKLSILITQSSYISKFSRDMFIPALPLLSSMYKMPYSKSEIIIAYYFLGISLARIIWPYSADNIEKNKLVLFLYACFLITTLGLFFSDKFFILVFLRCLQAFFIASIPIIVRSEIHDQFGTDRSIKIYSYTSIITAWASPISISIAAILLTYYNLNTLIFLLFLFTLSNLLSVKFLRQFPAPYKQINSKRKYTTTIFNIIKKKDFWFICVPLSLIMTGIGIFQSIASFLLIQTFNLTLFEFSLSFFILIACRLAGKLLAGKLIDFIDKELLITLSTIICLFSGVIGLINSLQYNTNNTLIYSLMLYYFALGIINPITKGLINHYLPDAKTTALGYLMSITSFTTFIGIYYSSQFKPSWYYLFLSLSSLSLISLIISFTHYYTKKAIYS